MLNYPLKRDVMLNLLKPLWELKLNGLALGLAGIECSLAKSFVGRGISSFSVSFFVSSI